MFQKSSLIFFKCEIQIFRKRKLNDKGTVDPRFAQIEYVALENPAVVKIVDFYNDTEH